MTTQIEVADSRVVGFVTLDVPDSTMTVARGVNPRGDIVDVYNDGAGTHGFLVRR
jgi:hypothetical protein